MAQESLIAVGAGGISNAWLPHLVTEELNVCAVVDLSIPTAQGQIDKYQLEAEASDDLPAMLSKYQPDFVLDLTIPEAHCDVTCTALEAGCHVIGEKPMAASMAEAQKMVRAARKAGKLYMVSQSRRWNALHDSVARTISKGKIGPITTVNCDFYVGAHFGGFRDEMPSPLLLDMAIHHFDLLRFMTDTDPVAVYTYEFNPSSSWYQGDVAATCIFEMTNGVVFTYRGSWCAEGCHTSWNGDWRFIGEKGTLLYEKDQPPRGEVVAGKSGFHRPLKELKPESSPLKFTEMHGALREMLNFLRTGKLPQTICTDNIKSLAMVFSAIESARSGKRVKIKI